MKKTLLLMMAIAPALLFAQPKPNIGKAEAALRAGKIDEAKTIIDVTTGSDDFMKDKKGNPSKNAAKAWFMRGLIYAAMDTTSKAQFKSLDPHPFEVAKDAFEKAKALDPKAVSLVTDAGGFPMLTENVNRFYAQSYFNNAITAYKAKDYAKTFELTEQTLYFIPEDTMVLLNAGVYFGPTAKEYEKSIIYIRSYLAHGGKSPDAWAMLFDIYRTNLKDNEKALGVAREAMVAQPNNPDYPKYELDMLVKLNKLPEAKVSMKKTVDAHPEDKESKYLLGLICQEMNEVEEAKKWYGEASKLDATYFDPALGMADLMYLDAKKVKKEMNQLGITADDKKKRFELDKVYVEKLKVAQPYFEACEKLSPDDAKVLDALYSIYADLDDQPKLAKLTKKMKTLGLLD